MVHHGLATEFQARVIRSGKPKPSTSSEKASATTPIIIGITAIAKGQAA